LSLATHPSFRRCGHASLLLADATEYARAHGVGHVTLEVRPSNRSAVRLYERFGFTAIGRQPGYYDDDGEDAVVMVLAMA
jgi:ribosomal-protein-alanine N-acetyltransferase